MDSPAALLRTSTLVFQIGLALIVVYRALTGRLRLRGLLSEVESVAGERGGFSPARAQLLLIASLSAWGILGGWSTSEGQSADWRILIPIVFGASNIIYLRSKIQNQGIPLGFFRRRRRSQ